MSTAVDSIANCVTVDERITTAGQPSDAELEAVRDAGFNDIVNLGLTDSDYSLNNEAVTVELLGMRYHHIPVRFDSPCDEQLDTFFDVMDGCSNSRVFIHCASNCRVACFFSLYAQSRYHWSCAQADAYIRLIWEPDSVWVDFMNKSRHRLGIGIGNDCDLTEIDPSNSIHNTSDN